MWLNMEQSGINTTLVRPVATAAGVLGFIQGIVWLVLSVLCILCYKEVILSPDINNTTQYYVRIYNLFLSPEADSQYDILINPKEFLIFTCVYIPVSLAWIILSGFLIWAMRHDKWHNTTGLFGGWSGVTLVTSLVDIIFTGLIARDYAEISNEGASETCTTAYGIVMSVAARGYILWLINVIFAAILIKFTVNLASSESKESALPIIHGYETNSVRPPWLDSGGGHHWENGTSTFQSTGSPLQARGNTPIQTSVGLPGNRIKRHDDYDYDYPNHHQEDYNEVYQNRGYESDHNANRPNQNRVYENVHDANSQNLDFPRSQSFYPVSPNLYVLDPPPAGNKNSFAEAIAHKQATIGRGKGRTSPLNKVPPPAIPEPDYSPPGSPDRPRSVLRSRSNY